MSRKRMLLALVLVFNTVAFFSRGAVALDKSLAIIKARPADFQAQFGLLDGKPVFTPALKVGQIELGNPDKTHTALPAASITTNPAAPSVTQHATQVAGIVLSSDATRKGVAPAVSWYSFAFNGATAPFPKDFIQGGDWLTSQGVTILNQSNSNAAGVRDGTSSDARYVDWLAFNKNMIFLQAAGNSGPGATTIETPADAYNAITVGATGANDVYNTVAGFSSEGRSTDLRNKPDIVAPGVGIATTTTPVSGFTTGNAGDVDGTSFSTPIMTGCAALLAEYGTNNLLSLDHKVIKSVFLNSASKDGGEKPGELEMFRKDGTTHWAPGVPGVDSLDDQMGAGQVNMLAALTQYKPGEALAGTPGQALISINPISWDLEKVAVGSQVDYKFNTKLAGGTKVTASLVWDRHVARTACTAPCSAFDDTFTATSLSNLNLVLVNGAGTELNLTDALGRTSFSASPVDSVEHIYFTLPGTDMYSLRVNLSGQLEEFGFAAWAHAVPEPTTGVLLVFGILLGTLRRNAR